MKIIFIFPEFNNSKYLVQDIIYIFIHKFNLYFKNIDFYILNSFRQNEEKYKDITINWVCGDIDIFNNDKVIILDCFLFIFNSSLINKIQSLFLLKKNESSYKLNHEEIDLGLYIINNIKFTLNNHSYLHLNYENRTIHNNDIILLNNELNIQEYNKNKKFFLFDLDGTLVLTDDIYYNIWSTILDKFNITLTEDLFKQYIQGNNDTIVLNRFLQNIDYNLLEISLLKDQLFIEHLNKIKVIEGAIEFIIELRKKGYFVSIVTNSNRCVAESIIKYCNINNYIDYLIIGNECSKPKPFSDPYLKALRLYDIPIHKSSEVVYIFEDSKTGILSGKNINPKCLIGVETIYNKEELINLGVNYSIKDYQNLDIDFIVHRNNNIYEYLKNNIKESLSKNYDVKNIIIDNSKLKGGYISDVIALKIETESEVLNCVLKLESKVESNLSKMALSLGLYEREYYFYENLSRYSNINIPKFYGLIKDQDLNNIGILLENLNSKNYELNINLNNNQIDTSLRVIHSFAKMHSKFWNKNLQKIFPELRKHNDPLFNPVWNDFINNHWDHFIQKWDKNLNIKQKRLACLIKEKFGQIQEYLSSNNLTLCHGDIKSPNIFYKKTETSYDPYFIDWQYIAIGKGTQDLVFFIIESFDTNKFDFYTPIFKNYYYSKLLEFGIQDYNYIDYNQDFTISSCYFPFFVAIWFGTTPYDDLIDKNFPFFFIQKLFTFLENQIDENILENL